MQKVKKVDTDIEFLYNLMIKNYTAFTLVELLVTISIVGILAAMSTAFFEQYRQKAYEAEASVNARNLYTAAYASNYQTNLIPGDFYQINFYPGRNPILYRVSGNISSLLPGYPYDRNKEMVGQVHFMQTGTNVTISAASAHCKGTSGDVNLYAAETRPTARRMFLIAGNGRTYDYFTDLEGSCCPGMSCVF